MVFLSILYEPSLSNKININKMFSLNYLSLYRITTNDCQCFLVSSIHRSAITCEISVVSREHMNSDFNLDSGSSAKGSTTSSKTALSCIFSQSSQCSFRTSSVSPGSTRGGTFSTLGPATVRKCGYACCQSGLALVHSQSMIPVISRVFGSIMMLLSERSGCRRAETIDPFLFASRKDRRNEREQFIHYA